jgi:diacylglycerol kinase family enzyme
MPPDTAAIVTVGGDGTVTHLLAEIAEKAVPLYVFPAGTENLLAHQFGHTRNVRHAVATIRAGAARWIDLGAAGGRLFAANAGAGFDAAVLWHLHAVRRGHISKFRFAGPLAEVYCNYAYPLIRVEVDGRRLCDDATLALVCNSSRYILGLRVARDATIDDGLLDVVCYRGRSFPHMVKHLLDTALRRHLYQQDCRAAGGRHVRLEADEPVLWQADGELAGTLPVDLSIRPRQVPVLLPAEDR